MNVEMLAVLTCISLLLSILFFVLCKDCKGKGWDRKRIWGVLFVVCFLLFCGGLSWWIASSNQPLRYEYTSFHNIKDVTFPDGSKVQMFTCDNTHHNVTSMFGKIVEDDWQVRRVRWSPIYLGVSYYYYSNGFRYDHYFLEHNDQISVEMNIEKDLPLTD